MRGIGAACHMSIIFAVILVLASPLGLAQAAQSLPGSDTVVEHTAIGRFDVHLTPNSSPEAPIGGMAISKTFHGDLDGVSTGQMLAVRTSVDGSAGYVAMERVSAKLGGKEGSFVLQHSGTMDRSASSLSVTVVPDSGTGGFAGLAGSMEINIEGGQHLYVFHYSLPQ